MPETKESLMRKHHLSEEQYYDLLTRFNEANYRVMYYLTASELLSLLNNYFERNAPKILLAVQLFKNSNPPGHDQIQPLR